MSTCLTTSLSKVTVAAAASCCKSVCHTPWSHVDASITVLVWASDSPANGKGSVRLSLNPWTSALAQQLDIEPADCKLAHRYEPVTFP